MQLITLADNSFMHIYDCFSHFFKYCLVNPTILKLWNHIHVAKIILILLIATAFTDLVFYYFLDQIRQNDMFCSFFSYFFYMIICQTSSENPDSKIQITVRKTSSPGVFFILRTLCPIKITQFCGSLNINNGTTLPPLSP